MLTGIMPCTFLNNLSTREAIHNQFSPTFEADAATNHKPSAPKGDEQALPIQLIKFPQCRRRTETTTASRHWWLTSVILATWEAGKIEVQDQPGQIVHETPSLKQPEQNGLEVWLKQ
jgi:hypothetical protein